MLAEDVERPGIAALRKLTNREPLSQDERARLCVYMAIQILRTPHMRDNFEKSFETMLNHMARRIMNTGDPERFAAVLAEKNKMGVKAAERLARDAKAAYLRGQIKLEVKPELSLASVFEHCNVYAEAMANWKWEVVTSSTTDFITSDCPVHFADKRHLALMDPEIAFHFPLSSKALLVMQFAEPEDRLWEKLSKIIPDRYLAGFRVWHNYISYREAEAREVDELNRITASMAEKNIYLGSETEAFNTILAEPSQNVRMKITAAGDELRMDLKGWRLRYVSAWCSLNVIHGVAQRL